MVTTLMRWVSLNIVYIRWFEDLRTAFINQHMNYSTMINQGISPILMKTEAEYKVPVTIHDKPVGRIYLVKSKQDEMGVSV